MIFRKFKILCNTTWFVFAVVMLLVVADTRKLSVNNVTCTRKDTQNNITITVIKAVGDKDVLYHIWSPTGSFSIMTVLANLATEYACNETYSSLLMFNPPPWYSFAVILTNIIEIDNENKTRQNSYDYSQLQWNDGMLITETDDTVSVEYKLLENLEHFREDDIKIKLTAYGLEERSEILPRLMHTSNSSVIDLTLNNTKTQFNSSQFEIGFYVLNGNSTEMFTETATSLIDDEYTPGVFKIVDLLPPSSESGNGGYVQWKPIIYETPDRSRESSSIVQDPSLLNKSVDEISRDCLPYIFYSNNLNMAQYVTVTFGKPGEDYQVSNYLEWTFSTGYGIPPEDKVSTVVIIIIAVGLGIPFLLIIVGSLYVFIKRCKVRNDDLSLSN